MITLIDGIPASRLVEHAIKKGWIWAPPNIRERKPGGNRLFSPEETRGRIPQKKSLKMFRRRWSTNTPRPGGKPQGYTKEEAREARRMAARLGMRRMREARRLKVK